MLIVDPPTAPWQKVGTDLFNLHGKDYPLMIDYNSSYPEVAQLSSTSAQSVITHMNGFLSDMEFHNVSSLTMVHSMTVVSLVNLQSYMDFNMSPLALCIRRQKKGTKL